MASTWAIDMSMCNCLTVEDLREAGFTHKGLLFGIYPIYVTEDAEFTARNWWPEWPIEVLLNTFYFFLDMTDPYQLNPTPISIKITGEL